MNETMKAKDFVLDDQLLMNRAVNYNRWLFSLVAPWLYGRVLEIGSGIGNITERILDSAHKVTDLT